MLLLKLDIAKDLDNVQWEYLLENMEQLGFGQQWRPHIPHLAHNIIQNFAKWRSWVPNKTQTWHMIGRPAFINAIHSSNGPSIEAFGQGNSSRVTQPSWC
jgi:hypothetical protein